MPMSAHIPTKEKLLLVSAKTVESYLTIYFHRTADIITEIVGLSELKFDLNNQLNAFSEHQ